MIVDLTTIKDRETFFDFAIEPSQIDLESETAKLRNAVLVQGKVQKGIAEIVAEGKISADLEIECNRCLQAVGKSLEIPFRAAFVTIENYTREKEAQINEQDLDVSILEEDKINLNELVREQLLLNLPEQVFCREDCKGLCQKCGTIRNLIDCNCDEKETDPRWAALKNLR